ncbi:hypothetical protein [Ideonella azotifigens]|uniref:Uncharacterized protein n=1 Tax=Ideonella azotifigens TaxID=513160 RepID=A0ABP3VQM8_9BURK|nr:hypothetical protein [Ideonella azotifigens]
MTRNTRRLLGWTAALLVLLLTFAAYRNPALMLDLATQVWNCV